MKIIHKVILASFALVSLSLLSSCTGWKMDYGKPAAQFHEESVLEKAPDYVGKKITIKGVVTQHDFSDPKNAIIYLNHGICCHFGKFKRMAEGYKVGEEVYIDGFLRRCEEGDILLKPALGRDPTAKFEPVE